MRVVSILFILAADALGAAATRAQEAADAVGVDIGISSVNQAQFPAPGTHHRVVNRSRVAAPEHGWAFNLTGKLGDADYRELMVPRDRGQQALRRLLDAASYLPDEVRQLQWRLRRVFGGDHATVEFEQYIGEVPVQTSRLSIVDGVVTAMSLFAADPDKPGFTPGAWLSREVLVELAEARMVEQGQAAMPQLRASDCAATYSWRGAKGYPICTVGYQITAWLPPGRDRALYTPVMEYWRGGYRCAVNALTGELLSCSPTSIR